MNEFIATGFEQVDRAADPGFFVRCLHLLSSLSAFQGYKRTLLELLRLRQGGWALEVGCGLGDDAIEMARRVGPEGKVVAIDASGTMLEEARRRVTPLGLPIELKLADARRLDLPARAFDACRIDRTLQHIAEQDLVVAEVARVLAPGGRLVAMEPDWETFVIDVGRRDVARRLVDLWCDSFPNGCAGRSLRRSFLGVGLTDVEVRPRGFVFTDVEVADAALDLRSTVAKAREAGVVGSADAAEWLEALERARRDGDFFCSWTGFLVSATRR